MFSFFAIARPASGRGISSHVSRQSRYETPCRHGAPATGQGHCRIHRCAAGRRHGELFSGRRDVRENQRERARARCFHHPADVPADQPEFDGIAHPGRCGETGQRGAHHRGDSIFRLRAPRPQRPAARPDHGEAGGKSPGGRRREPVAHHGPACPAVAGIFRHSGRPSLCLAHSDQAPAEKKRSPTLWLFHPMWVG